MATRLLIFWIALSLGVCLSPPAALAQVPAGMITNSTWYRGGSTLDLDFVKDRYWLNGTSYSGVSNFITGAGATYTRPNTTTVTSTSAPFYTSSAQGFVSRASSGTYFDSSGTLQTASNNVARSSTYTYSAGSWNANSGTLIEPAATNNITNNTMSGVTAFSSTELISTGTFAACSGATCTGWTTTVNGGTGTVSFGSNTATLTGDNTNAASIYQAVTTVSGNTYNIWVSTGAGNAVTLQAGTTSGGAQLLSATTIPVSSTSASFQFTATGTTSYIRVNNTSTTSATVTLVSTQSGGHVPTGWSIYNAGTGLAFNIVGSGTENGISYVDIRWFGTTVASGFPYIAPGATCTMMATTQWGVITSSAYIKLQAGALTNMTSPQTTIHAKSSGCADPGTNVGTSISSISSSNLSQQRFSVSTLPSTFSSTTTAYAWAAISYNVSASKAVDVTLRIGMPQFETGSTATSVISTSSGAATRAADLYSVPRGGTYYDSSGNLTQAAVDTPRLDYDVGGGSYPKGLMMESGSTNSVRNNMLVGADYADGVERVATGTFAACSGATCTGWTTTVNGGTGSVSFASNTATLTGDNTNAASIYQAITTVSGYSYIVSVTTGSGNAVTVQGGTSAGGTQLFAATSGAASTTSKYQFTATGTTSYVQVNNTSTTAANVTTVSVQSAGKVPTNWTISGGSGLTASITGLGTENGIPYIQINYSGTTTALSNAVAKFEPNTAIAALQTQSWTASGYVKLSAGSWGSPAQASQWIIQEYDSGGSQLTQSSTLFSPVPSGSSLASQRYIKTYTLANASTAFASFLFLVQYSTSTSVNFTIRIGLPQMEQSTFPTSVIPTYGSAVTRAADAFTVPTTATGASGAWYTDGIGTVGGALNSPYSVAAGTSSYLFDIDDGTANNAVQHFILGSSPKSRIETFVGGSFASLTANATPSYSSNTLTKMVVAWQASSGAFAADAALVTSLSTTVPTGLTTLRIGRGRGGGGAANNWISRLWYMPTRQADATLTDYSQ